MDYEYEAKHKLEIAPNYTRHMEEEQLAIFVVLNAIAYALLNIGDAIWHLTKKLPDRN